MVSSASTLSIHAHHRPHSWLKMDQAGEGQDSDPVPMTSPQQCQLRIGKKVSLGYTIAVGETARGGSTGDNTH